MGTISHKGVRYSLGLYDTAKAAGDAYDKFAAQIHGEFAREQS
jgi:hypothetical protein